MGQAISQSYFEDTNDNKLLFHAHAQKNDMFTHDWRKLLLDKELLRKVQLTQLEIAKEIKRVCDEYNICYFLEGGTLLGAVRHKGFIPWDDDMDISMTRENYEKFLKIAPDALDSKYRIQTWDTSEYVPLPFAKVMKRDTIFLESYANPNVYNEIWVDIFPRDHYPDEKNEQKEMRRKIQFYRHVMIIKCGYKPWNRAEGFMDKLIIFIKYSPYFLLSLFFSSEWIKIKWNNVLTKYNDINTKQLCFASMLPIDDYIVPSETINEYCDLSFEDTTFKCPINYDLFLKSIYGDYMKLPPVEERENRHRIISIKT